MISDNRPLEGCQGLGIKMKLVAGKVLDPGFLVLDEAAQNVTAWCPSLTCAHAIVPTAFNRTNACQRGDCAHVRAGHHAVGLCAVSSRTRKPGPKTLPVTGLIFIPKPWHPSSGFLSLVDIKEMSICACSNLIRCYRYQPHVDLRHPMLLQTTQLRKTISH